MVDKRQSLESAQSTLKQARAFRRKKERELALAYYFMANAEGLVAQRAADPHVKKADPVYTEAIKVREAAYKEAARMCDLKPRRNPTKAEEYGALGAGAGALLLGPVGALAGGYMGVKQAKKKKRKKNPNGKRRTARRGQALRRMMRGT